MICLVLQKLEDTHTHSKTHTLKNTRRPIGLHFLLFTFFISRFFIPLFYYRDENNSREPLTLFSLNKETDVSPPINPSSFRGASFWIHRSGFLVCRAQTFLSQVPEEEKKRTKCVGWRKSPRSKQKVHIILHNTRRCARESLKEQRNFSI